MIDKLIKFANGYRLSRIKETNGMEGVGFMATILKEGKVIGRVADYSDGAGINTFDMSDKDEAELIAYAKTLFPEMPMMHQDQFFFKMVNYEASMKELRSKAKKKIIQYFDEHVDEFGVGKQFAFWNYSHTPENIDSILQHYPDTKILNDQLLNFPAITVPKK